MILNFIKLLNQPLKLQFSLNHIVSTIFSTLSQIHDSLFDSVQL